MSQYQNYKNFLESQLGCPLIVTSVTTDMAGRPRTDREHKSGRAEDWALNLKNGMNVSGIKGYRLSGNSLRLSNDIWFILHVNRSYRKLLETYPQAKSFSVLIEHDHLHVIDDGVGSVWVMSGFNGDPCPIVTGFRANRLVNCLKEVEIKPIVV
jgi:hypothetical protein